MALGSYMVNYGMSLNIVEEIKTNNILGAMAGVAAFIKGTDVVGLDAKGVLGALLTFYWGGAMVGRFAGSALMRSVKPSTLLAGAALMASALIGLSIASSGVAALLLLLAVGLCNSVMFPTIFTLAIEDLGEGKPQVLESCAPPLWGRLHPACSWRFGDGSGFALAFALPIVATCTSRGIQAGLFRLLERDLRAIWGASQVSLTSWITLCTPDNFFACECVLLAYGTSENPTLNGT